jgi:O-antigen ligase
MYSNSLNTIITFMSVIAIFFFSYIPFLYCFSIIGIEKNIIFILLISAILILVLFSFTGQMLRGKIQFYKRNITALSSYILFVIYALISFFLIGEKLNDLFTIRTLVLVNPVFLILALLCLQNKKDVVKMIILLSGIYLFFLITSFAQGNIFFSSDISQNIFMDMEGSYYQNINTYLGLFAICNLGFLSSDKKHISMIAKILITLSIMGMFLIGGRSSIVALMAILFMYFFKEHMLWSFKISAMSKKMIIIFALVGLLIFYFAEIAKVLDASITWKRFISITEEGDESERIFLFSNAIALFFSDVKTMVFGAGINSFPVYIGDNTTGMYPHNIILELLAEYGIIGTIIFTVPVVYIMRIRKKILGSVYGNSIDEKISFLLFIYYLIIYMFSGGLRNSGALIFFIYLLIPAGREVRDKYFYNNCVT